MPFVQVNDVKLRYEMEGSGPPLLMIGGTGLPGATWRTGPSAQYAAEGFTVITFDHRGTGGSDKPDNVRWSFEVVKPRRRFAAGMFKSSWR